MEAVLEISRTNECPSREELLEQAFCAIMELTAEERREVVQKFIINNKEVI